MRLTADNATRPWTTDANGAQTPDTKNLTYERSWNAGGAVIDGDNGAIGYSDHVLSLWRSDVDDENGQSIYYLWSWSQATPDDGNDVERLSAEIDLQDYTAYLTDFDPATQLTVDEREYDIGLETEILGLTIGLDTTITVDDGEIGPASGGIDGGAGGEYTCRFTGDNGETTQFNSVVEVRTSGTVDTEEIVYTTECEMSTGGLFG
jgi:hypothetical protein